ncbi:MAG: hypothetical protein ACRDNK_16470 [Solirubrobacteraceae bacterium]
MKRMLTCSALALATAVTGLGQAAAGAARPGDRIRIVAPTLVRSQIVYDLTVQGFARRRASAYLFVDYSGCASSFAAEARRVPHAHDSYAVVGRFAEVSGWRSSSAGTDHACAYLVSHSGVQLASDRISFPIR